jgi:hypothetical protein
MKTRCEDPMKTKKQQVVVTDVGGRPTQYLAAYPKTCAFLAARGATVAEMADACGV